MSDIIAIGEAMLEMACDGDMKSARTFTRSYGGDTFNTAVAAARLGSSVTYVTRLGQDLFSQGLAETLEKEGIKKAVTKPVKENLGLYFVSVDSHGERTFSYARENSSARQLSPDDITPELIQNAKIVYATGITLAISPSARAATMKAFKLAKEAGITTAFDPNYRKALWPGVGAALDALNEILPLVDVFLPSYPEDTSIYIDFQRPEQIVDYFLMRDVRLVVAKAGSQGCFLGFSAGGKKDIQHIAPQTSTKAVDTTGAGDAFNAGFLHGLTTDASLLQCAKLGNTTAALKILNRGSALAMPTKEAVYNRVYH